MGRASRRKKERREGRQPAGTKNWVGVLDFKGRRFSAISVQSVQGICLPLVVMTNDDAQLIGTCFNVSSRGLFVTAKHVIDEAHNFQAEHPGSWIGVSWSAPGTPEHKRRGVVGEIFEVRTIVDSDSADVALVWIEENAVGRSSSFPVLPIDFRVPQLGAHIVSFGFSSMTTNWSRTSNEIRTVDVDARCSATHGQVVENHPEGRDNFRITFPAFQANTKFVGGMSGGPVVNADSGGVCGIVCAGYESDDEEVAFTSYASLSVSLLILGVLEGHNGAGPDEVLFHLAKRGEIPTVGGMDGIEVERLGPLNWGLRFNS